MAKKYYAVAKGREGSGIYTDWGQTEQNVRGISGVKFKSFPSRDLAAHFLKELGIPADQIQVFPEHASVRAESEQTRSSQAGAREKEGSPEGLTGADSLSGQAEPFPGEPEITASESGAALQADHLVAYVDGSFRQGHSVYGYGVVILAGDRVIKTLSGTGSRPEYVAMRNVAGEVLGAIKAMQYAMAAGARSLVLHFDYQGIESWAIGTWKRNNDLTRGYHEFVRSVRPRLSLTFRKVKGHSGDAMNDLADELAKQAVLNESARNKD